MSPQKQSQDPQKVTATIQFSAEVKLKSVIKLELFVTCWKMLLYSEFRKVVLTFKAPYDLLGFFISDIHFFSKVGLFKKI